MRTLRSVSPIRLSRSTIRRIALAAMWALGLVPFVMATPVDAAAIYSDYAIPTPFSSPQHITSGPDGALWFTETSGNKVGRITTSGVLTEFPIPSGGCGPGSGPQGIAAGPDDALWFAEQNFNCGQGQIGRVTTSGTFTEYPLPFLGCPSQITAGPDGALWFTAPCPSAVGRITTSGGFSEYLTPTANSGLFGITAGPDGALWFTEDFAGKVGRITTSGTFTEFPVRTGLAYITAGPDGNLWFTEYSANMIGRITTSGTLTEYPIPTNNSNPGGITTGRDGALWFTERNASQIGRITTSGNFSEFPIPSGRTPNGIAAGSDAALWFAEVSGNSIGRLMPGAGPPANLNLAPKTQVVTVNTNTCLTATVTDKSGTAVPNVNVVFSVATAAVTQASPSSGTQPTNGSGHATFCYSARNSGQDDVHAFADSNNNGVQDPGEPSDDATVTWFAFATSTGATFVIGDLAPSGSRPAVPGDTVTWWSSQWPLLNPMTGGPPPSSMKGFAGFEDMPATPNCGQTWTTDPGNSTPPPSTVPDYMGVIVSSHVTQSGSVISGDVKHIVVVKTNPGYAPNPGNAGTGTVVAYLC